MFLLVCMVWFEERKLSHVFVIKWNSVFDTVYFCICVFDIVFCLILAKGDNVFGEEQAYSCPHQPPSPYQCPVNINTNTDHQKHTNTQTISNKNTHNYTHSFLHTNVPSTLTQTLNITNTQIRKSLEKEIFDITNTQLHYLLHTNDLNKNTNA